jgi:3-carboxy-cis,cis-muconate cycloisomerase
MWERSSTFLPTACRYRSMVTDVPQSFEKLAIDTDIVGYPVLPLVEQMTEMISPEHAKYIHWGATTQDIQDCASMLQMKDGIALVRRQVVELIGVLERLSEKHRDT